MNYHCFCGFSTDRKFSLQRHLRKKRCEEIYGKRFDFEQIPSRKRRAKDFINLDSTESTSSKQIEESAIASNSADIPPGSTAVVVAEETVNLEESINQEVSTKLEHHEEGQEDSMNVDLNE